MTNKKPLLLIPVENQVRELDPKLLLACVAAHRGFDTVIGSRREMEFSIDAFPRCIYLSKSMTVRSLLFFQVAHVFGQQIVTWDEEALVHLPPEVYFSRRLDPRAIRYVSHLFAWGEDNVALWHQYPHLPPGVPVHATGNPRSDMLREEMRAYYDDVVADIRAEYGDFILINTNFNHVNAFGPDMNLFKPARNAGQAPKFGRAARGMTRAYAEGLRDHKQAVFEAFQHLIPALSRAFPECTIVVRPHPTESKDVYRQIAADCERVQVTNEGNVVPWLMAARALIHNGCTTGVEAYQAGVPAISYRAVVNEAYDDGFYQLPNRMSHQCFSFDELCAMLKRILSGELGTAGGEARQALIQRFLSAGSGPLACERIVDVIAKIADEQGAGHADPGAATKLKRLVVRKGLHFVRDIKSHLPGSHNRPEFQRHRYPQVPIETIQERVDRFQRLLGRRSELKVKPIMGQFFHIASQDGGEAFRLPSERID